MSEKTQKLEDMKKSDLIGKVYELQEKVADLKVEDSPRDTTDKVTNLISEINRLKEDLKVARETEKFVAIENLSLGRVWLYSPESKSGLPEDREKGRFLKRPGELAVIPSYWMATYIADRAPAFLKGEVRLNNKKGKSISPHLIFQDFDLPVEFTKAVVPNEKIIKAISGSAEDFHDFVDKYRKQPFILSRAFGIIDREANKAEDKSQKKFILEGYVSFLQEVLHPAVKEPEEKEEVQVII